MRKTIGDVVLLIAWALCYRAFMHDAKSKAAQARRLKFVPYLALAWLIVVLALNAASIGGLVNLQYQGF